MKGRRDFGLMKQILVTRSSMPSLEEYVEEIRDIWDTHWMTNMGVHHEKLKEQLKGYLDVEELTLFVNGHSALELSIQALKLSGEVITTPFTFASTTHAIVRNGLEPVFCDINETDYTMDASKIEGLITEKTSAILPVHVYGNLCDIGMIEQIARKHGLKVIYDAAHAFGETFGGKGIASYGDVSVFSFHATKVFNTIEGGAAAYRDRTLGDVVRGLLNFGIKNEEVVDEIGCNAKMNEFAAAMGICNLKHIEGEIARRKEVAEAYLARLAGTKGLRLPDFEKSEKPNYAYFPILVEEKVFGQSRDEIYASLKKHGIHPRKYFYPLVNMFDCYEGRFDVRQTPIARKIAERILCLPIYAGLEINDVARICGIITEGR